MAARSLLRKMPALGLRSSPTAPITRAVHKLSPAAGSRLVSTDVPPDAEAGQYPISKKKAEEGAKVYSRREEIKLIDENMKEIRRDTDSFPEILRPGAEDMERFRKGHEKIRKACAVYLLLVCVPAAILLSLI